MFSFLFKPKNIDISKLESKYLFLKDESKKYTFQDKFKNQEPYLLKVFGRVEEKQLNKIKLIVITDTHNALQEEVLVDILNNHPDYDLCLLLGDHSSGDIEKVLKYIPKNKIYALLGNHDYNYIADFELNNLNGKIIEVNKVKLLGIEGSFKYKPAPFPSFTQEESIEFLKDKTPVDILVSHDGPFDDTKANNPAHQGLFGITYYLYKNKIKYNIHGHLHNPSNKELLNGTKEICLFNINYIELD